MITTINTFLILTLSRIQVMKPFSWHPHPGLCKSEPSHLRISRQVCISPSASCELGYLLTACASPWTVIVRISLWLNAHIDNVLMTHCCLPQQYTLLLRLLFPRRLANYLKHTFTQVHRLGSFYFESTTPPLNYSR